MGDEAKKRRLTRRKSVAGGRGLAQPRKETEVKKKPAAFCRNTTQLMGIIKDTRSLCGAIFDIVIMATDHDVVKSLTAHARLYNEGVQGSWQRPHTGPTSDLGMGRIDRGSRRREQRSERPLQRL